MHTSVHTNGVCSSNGTGGEVFFRFAPKNGSQKRAAAAYCDNDVLFMVGEAGGGKTATAIGLALQDLVAGRVAQVVVARPMIGAGETLAALPGGIEEKVAPWLAPVGDALDGQTFPSQARQLLTRVQFVPLAVMRGRTFANAVVVIDEAQNCTVAQCKLFLSRLGRPGKSRVSKLLVTGDLTQSDLPPGRSGLSYTIARLEGLAGVGVVRFEPGDNLRHPLVAQMLARLQD